MKLLVIRIEGLPEGVAQERAAVHVDRREVAQVLLRGAGLLLQLQVEERSSLVHLLDVPVLLDPRALRGEVIREALADAFPDGHDWLARDSDVELH
eukprot:5951636-Alexandrium_andersonii.AAC.1